MSNTALALLAFLPLILAGVLLIGFRMTAKVVMPIVFIVTTVIALTAWQMSVNRVVASAAGPDSDCLHSMDYLRRHFAAQYPEALGRYHSDSQRVHGH